MKRYIFKIILLFIIMGIQVPIRANQPQKAFLVLKDSTLMYEIRKTPFPLNGDELSINPPRFMWPDRMHDEGPVLDGIKEDKKEKKEEISYCIRYSQDANMKKEVVNANVIYAFYNPFKVFSKGVWYWQHGVKEQDGSITWSKVLHFTVTDRTTTFNPPSFQELSKNIPTYHPRLLLDKKEWNKIIKRNKKNKEINFYRKRTKKCFNHPIQPLKNEIDTTHVVKLKNRVQRRALLVRESRKIVDREEAWIESLVKMYLLTKETRYREEAIKRTETILSWRNDPLLAGDFNKSTILKLTTGVYDSFYNELSKHQKKSFLEAICQLSEEFYHHYLHHLENRLADNHVWQMTLRILTQAAFVALHDVPEAEKWADYCYNEWVSRFPGLNDDGAWHNGDSYFQVNIRTLVELPEFFGRYTGFNYFNDPWYEGNCKYVLYQQLPFAHGGGHGSSHESKKTPNCTRIGYADALAREIRNPYATAYVNAILEKEPNAMKSHGKVKSGDLTWYRCITTKRRPKTTLKLQDMQQSIVFPETGLATFHTHMEDCKKNAKLTFRSSPYGGTSHQHANQNAWNCFWGGKPIFYSSGQRTGFTDKHSMYSYRNSRAHNTILVDGMTQKIGVEGYGWIPRFYTGEEISYALGDASNAYGIITSPLWLKRAKLSNVPLTPEKGWDVNKVKCFRRHVVQLGKVGIYILYDELEAKTPVSWQYQLHTRRAKMKVFNKNELLAIQGKNEVGGVARATILSSSPMEVSQTNQFFEAPVDWLKKHKKSKDDIQWHLTVNTQKTKVARILTVLDVHGKTQKCIHIKKKGHDEWRIPGWIIKANVTSQGEPYLQIENKKTKTILKYNMKGKFLTEIVDHKKNTKKTVVLKDQLPKLEI